MFRPFLAIARNAFVEGVRQPVFLVLVLAAGVLQILNTWNTGFSMDYDTSGEVSADNKLLFDIGLATVFLCATLLAAFIATAVLSREIDNKTVLTVVSKPIGRPVLVLGKYAGVVGAILVASLTMLLFLLLAIRHGVMSTAADELDGPVLAFGLGGAAMALGIAAWTNYFYGWSFPQTSAVLLLPFTLLAYALVLCVSKEWHWQSPAKDFKPQILICCGCLTMAILLLAAVATAASTRLGQVMTIVVCGAVLLGGMLSNYFIGRNAVSNRAVAVVKSATPVDPSRPSLAVPGVSFDIEFESPPRDTIRAGAPFYFGANPNGFALAVGAFAPAPDTPAPGGAASGVYFEKADGQKAVIRHTGAARVSRSPEAGDFVFLTPTRINAPALALWSVVPNLQFFWLIDAVSQNNPVPPGHMLLVVLYGIAQIVAFLALAVMLFQKRDVG